MKQLSDFGWTDEFQQRWADLDKIGLQPARVIADFGTSLKLAMPDTVTAELSGKLAHYTAREHVPKVGDWVTVRMSDRGEGVVEAVIPRRSELARKAAGNPTVKQVIAANIDIAFVLLALDNDFSIERLERFLYQLSADHIEPVIVLNKADKTNDVTSYKAQLEQFKLPIITCIATTGAGVPEILAHIHPGKTAILLGSSGVGKSTLTNRLLGRDTQKTQEVRASDAMGRHTTVHRELFVLPGGGLLIDTPGIRELQLWGTQEDLKDTFDDVIALIHRCKYTTCKHVNEPGCAVQQALRDGTLTHERLANFKKMNAELAMLKEKNMIRKKLVNKRSFKAVRRRIHDEINDMKSETD